VKYSLYAAILCGALLVSCGEQRPDPKEAYAGLVKAAQKGDGGQMYDYLDSNFRTQVDQMIEMQKQGMDRMPPEERAKWVQMNGLKGRDAFAKMVSLNTEMMTSRFKGDYKILKVDTVVVLTVQHANQPADIMFMRYEKGGYKVTAPPSAPQPPTPQMHPPVTNPHGDMAPQGGAPNAGGPEGAAPQTAPQAAPQGGAAGGAPAAPSGK
jgi:hypothetical protein